MRKKNILLPGALAVACSAWFSACAPKPQMGIVLLRTTITTNHIPEYVTSGSPGCPTCLNATIHAARDEVVTNYVLGYRAGTNAIELITAEKR